MSSEPQTSASARLLEVRTVEVVAGRGRSVTLSSVRCPIRGRSAAVEECAHCGEGSGIAQDPLGRGACLCCGAPPRLEPRAPAERARVSEVMRRSSVALRPGVGRGVAADALRSRGVDSAPVVDGDGRPIGLVAEADLLRARRGTRVADAMTRVALSVPEHAPVSRATALMVGQRTERVAVVSHEGVVVGVLSAMDVVAWLAADGPLAADDVPGGL